VADGLLSYFSGPMRVLDMMSGYAASQVLAAVARFGVPDLLADGPRSSPEIARALEADADAMERLLRAAASVGILVRGEDGRYGQSEMSRALETGARPSLRDLVIAQVGPGHWLPWGRLHDAVKSGQAAVLDALGTDLWSHYAAHPEEAACFARGMGDFSSFVAAEVIASFDFSRFRLAVDVGGSQGAMISAVLRAAPEMYGILFDRPEVIEAARETIASYALGDRLRIGVGSFLEDVPGGADLYIVKSVLHDWDDARASLILRNVHRAAANGATLLVAESMLPASGVSKTACFLDLNVFLALGGRVRSEREYAELAETCGWSFVGAHHTPGMMSIVEAQKR
jgi:hypothetical protein